MVLDPKQQNFTHLISFEEALEKVLDRFNQILNNLPEYDGIVLLCHEEESMAYFLKAVKKSGLYEKFCFLVKGLGYVCQYLSGEFYIALVMIHTLRAQSRTSYQTDVLRATFCLEKSLGSFHK